MPKLIDQALLPPRFLFRFSMPLKRWEGSLTEKGVGLGDAYGLMNLGELDGARVFAEIRAAWNDAGLLFTLCVDGKRQQPWCRDSRLEESDGLQLWIDTRATHNIHRASKHCHRFVFLPGGGGREFDRPVADQLLINRARENARPIRPRELTVRAAVRKTGYTMSAFVPSVALEGYDPVEHRQLGFQYAVHDRELGVQTFSCGPGMPYEEDPSLWATLEMED